MADPDSDDLGQDGADPFDGVTAAQLLAAAAKAQSFAVEVSEPFEVLEWRPPRDTPQGRMPASVKVQALLERARDCPNEQSLLEGERFETRYGRKLAISSGPTYDEIPVDYGGGRRGPLAAGTIGRLVAMDADTGRSKRTGAASFPELSARHRLAHGVFVPGLRAGADTAYQVPGQADDLIFIGSDDLSAGLAWTTGDTSTELRGATIKIGANAIEPAVLGQQLSNALTNAGAAAAAATVPNDGGAASWATYNSTLATGLATILSQIVTVE